MTNVNQDASLSTNARYQSDEELSSLLDKLLLNFERQYEPSKYYGHGSSDELVAEEEEDEE